MLHLFFQYPYSRYDSLICHCLWPSPHPKKSIFVKFSPYAFVCVHSIRSNQWSMETTRRLFYHFIVEKVLNLDFQSFFCIFLIIRFLVLTFPYVPNFSTILNARGLGLVSKWRKWSALQLNRAGILDFTFNVSRGSTVLQYTPYSYHVL